MTSQRSARYGFVVRVVAAVVALCAGVGVVPAFGQADGAAEDLGPGLSEVAVRVARVGPGGLARRGDWCGILLEVEDRGLQQRELVLRVAVEDRDGDTAQYERVVASNPGIAQSFWVYAWLPASGRGVSASVHRAVEVPVDESDPPGLRGFAAGAVLAGVPVDLNRAASASEGLMGVVGPAGFGLRKYAGAGSGPGSGAGADGRSNPAGHEATRVATGLLVDELPDRWHGLGATGVLVWGEGEGASPAGLSLDQARAVKEWVARGGHLVVVLREAGGVWLSEADNPLFDVLPVIEPPLRREGVDLERYRALLCERSDAELPGSVTVRSFRRASGAGAQDAMPILAGAGGDVVAVRRLVGAGAVTLIGIDLGHPRLRSAGLPEVESFWHRVLGRRGPVVGGVAELTERLGEDAARIAGRRDPAVFDGDIEEQIDTSRRAAAGVLLGFLVFGAYWLVAGPVGYWLLGRAGMKRHAWVGFALAAAVFSAVAWGGATAIRPDSIEVQHLTVVDSVHGQTVQRAQGWGSVLAPWYGDATIAVEDGDYSDAAAEGVGLRRWHDLLAPWSPVSGLGLVGGFPDNRGYRIEARAPDSATVPARSTVKQFRIDWAGTGRWALPTPTGLPGDTSVPELTLREDGSVDGFLRHDLPGDLEDVVFVWVTGQRPIRARGSADRALIAEVRTNKLVDPWGPGQRLDVLAATVGGEPAERYLSDLLETGRRLGLGATGAAGGPIERRVVALSLFSQLPTPDLSLDAQLGRVPIAATRTAAHSWDLGRWFTQPCLIVIGQLVQSRDADGPAVPLTVDGRVPAASGRTVVRCVFPLRADPPAWGGGSSN